MEIISTLTYITAGAFAIFILTLIAVKVFYHVDRWEPEKPKLKLDRSLEAFKTYTRPDRKENGEAA